MTLQLGSDIVKDKNKNLFEEYINTLDDFNKQKVNDFLCDIQLHCNLSNNENRLILNDFKNGILYYNSIGISLDKSLELLNPEYLGGFYARGASVWFSLDDSAKIYPVSIKHGTMSIFRVSAYLKQQVVPQLLQLALTFTIKRFPSLATTLKKGFFWHYLDSTKRHFNIEKETNIPCQPLKVSVSGSQAFRVLYYENRISIEFFHVLTDGTGGMEFLKALVAEYIRLTGVVIDNQNLIMDINQTPSASETRNEFPNVEKSKSTSGIINKLAIQMDGDLAASNPCRMLHFKMDATKLYQTAKKFNSTVTAYLLSLMFIAHKAATDKLHGETAIMVPVNMRKFYPSKTLRNFSLYCSIRVSLENIEDTQSIIDDVKEQLTTKGSKEAMTEMNTAAHKLVSSIKLIPLFIKQPIARIMYGILGDNAFTNTLSNLGVVKLPKEYEQHIDYFDFSLGTAVINRASCGLITYNNTAVFSITKRTFDPTFEEKLLKLLQNDGIEVIVEGSEIYER